MGRRVQAVVQQERGRNQLDGGRSANPRGWNSPVQRPVQALARLDAGADLRSAVSYPFRLLRRAVGAIWSRNGVDIRNLRVGFQHACSQAVAAESLRLHAAGLLKRTRETRPDGGASSKAVQILTCEGMIRKHGIRVQRPSPP